MATELQHKRQAWSVLIVSTWSFTVCFMVWMMFGVIGIPIKKMLDLNATQFGLLTATPVLTGSLIRVPLGIWTDRYGGRIVMALLMAVTVPAMMAAYTCGTAAQPKATRITGATNLLTAEPELPAP